MLSQKQNAFRMVSVVTRFFFLFLYLLVWHMLPSHASAEACLTGWPNVQPQGRDCVLLRDTIRLT